MAEAGAEVDEAEDGVGQEAEGGEVLHAADPLLPHFTESGGQQRQCLAPVQREETIKGWKGGGGLHIPSRWKTSVPDFPHFQWLLLVSIQFWGGFFFHFPLHITT